MRLIPLLLSLSLTACGLLPANTPPVKLSKEKASAIAEEYAGGQADLEHTKLATLSAINAEVQMPFGTQSPPVNGLTGNELSYLVPLVATETKPFKRSFGDRPYQTGWAIINADESFVMSLKLMF